MRAALLILTLAPLSSGAWIRVTSPQFEILSDAGERHALLLAARLSQIANVLPVDDAPRPRVFLFATEAELRDYHDTAEGFFQAGVERDYIALQDDAASHRVAFHEFVHLVLSRSAVPLPLWFEEGTAEFYSTLNLSRDRVQVGEPIQSHVATLRRGRSLSAAELASVTSQSPEYRRHDRSSLFYAQSWALVHMLNLAPAWRDGMAGFVLALSAGRPSSEAFESAFGRSMDAALADLPGYLAVMHPVTVGAPPPSLQAETRAEPLSADRAQRVLIELAIETHRDAQARRLVEIFAKENPRSPETPAVRASLALAEGRRDEALADFETAIRLGTRDAAVYLEYAMLQRDRHALRSQVDALLEHAIALDPDFGQAQFLLGVGQTDDGNFASAIDHLKMAVRARPRRSDYWHALAYAQLKLHDTVDALASARRAVAVSENATQEDMARALVALAESPADPPPAHPADLTPPSWTNPKGDARVEGTVERVDCEGDAASLLVRSRASGETLALRVHHPRQVELVNSPPDFQLSCGPQQLQVAIEYNAADREVTRIEFQR